MLPGDIRKYTLICSFVQNKCWKEEPETENNWFPIKNDGKGWQDVGNRNGVAGTGGNHTSLSLFFGIALMYRPTAMFHIPKKEKKETNQNGEEPKIEYKHWQVNSIAWILWKANTFICRREEVGKKELTYITLDTARPKELCISAVIQR